MGVPKFLPNDLVRRVGSSEIFTVKVWYEAVKKYSVWIGEDAGTQSILAEGGWPTLDQSIKSGWPILRFFLAKGGRPRTLTGLLF
jgi:hypothetical protein